MQKVRLPLYLNFEALRNVIGIPYKRTHLGRLMNEPEYAEQRFPRSHKLGTHRNSPPMWYTPEVLDYLKRRGLPVPEDIDFS